MKSDFRTVAELQESPTFAFAATVARTVGIEAKCEAGDEGAEDEQPYIQLAHCLFVPLEYPAYRIDTLSYGGGDYHEPPSVDLCEGEPITNSCWRDGICDLIKEIVGEAIDDCRIERCGKGDIETYNPFEDSNE